MNEAVLGILWNLFLAVVPVVLAYSMVWVARLSIKRSARIVIDSIIFVVWLGFLPNTCYLITEWRHFMSVVDLYDLYLKADSDNVLFARLCMLWIAYFAYSGFGMFMFALAIRPMEHLGKERGITTWFWTIPLFIALSLGVYLGLILRYNTWDLITRPGLVWTTVVSLGMRPYLVTFIIAFGVFLWFAYEVIDIWIDGLVARWQKFRNSRSKKRFA